MPTDSPTDTPSASILTTAPATAPRSSRANTLTFKLLPDRRFWWPVRFTLPSTESNGSERIEHGFEAQFQQLDTVIHQKLVSLAVSERWTADQFARNVVTSFRKVVDERDVEMAFSSDTLDLLLKVQGVADAIVSAYFEALQPPEKGSIQPPRVAPIDSAA